jgi:HrpA-like RNA helicase
MIIASTSSLKNKLEVHTLHGHLFPNDFKKIFCPAPADKRKVILSTNIAETSISFDDVICVIDSGLFRDRENDVVFTNPKKTQWISKVNFLNTNFGLFPDLVCYLPTDGVVIMKSEIS